MTNIQMIKNIVSGKSKHFSNIPRSLTRQRRGDTRRVQIAGLLPPLPRRLPVDGLVLRPPEDLPVGARFVIAGVAVVLQIRQNISILGLED